MHDRLIVDDGEKATHRSVGDCRDGAAWHRKWNAMRRLVGAGFRMANSSIRQWLGIAVRSIEAVQLPHVEVIEHEVPEGEILGKALWLRCSRQGSHAVLEAPA